MNKLLIVASVLLATACTDLTQYTTADSDASAKTKMRACMVSEAQTKFQAGTLFTNGVSSTADELVNTCLQKLALQSAGISEESQSTAVSIIQNLKSLTGSSSN